MSEKREKGPLLQSKTAITASQAQTASLKDEVTFAIPKKGSKTEVKSICPRLNAHCFYSDASAAKEFDSSKIESPLLDPKIMERKATASTTNATR